jgi:acetyltransferase
MKNLFFAALAALTPKKRMSIMLDCVASAMSVPVQATTPSIPPVLLDDLAEVVTLPDGRRVLLRPIRPEDEAAHQVFAARISREDLYFRFFQIMSPEALHSQVIRFTHIDYDREMAFVAVPVDAYSSDTLGVVRVVKQAAPGCAEFAVTVRSDLKGLGLGETLTRKIIAYSRAAGARRLFGQILVNNRRMLRLVKKLGFSLKRIDGHVVEAHMDLREEPPEARSSAHSAEGRKGATRCM